MQPYGRVIFLIGIIVIAGCSGLITDSRDTSQTITPAPVPADTATEARAPIGGGSNSSAQVINPESLTKSHAAYLGNSSYTIDVRRAVQFSKGDFIWRRQIIGRLDRNGSFTIDMYLSRRDNENRDGQRTMYWSNGRKVLKKSVRNQSINITVIRDDLNDSRNPVSVLPFDPKFERDLLRLLTNTKVANVSRNTTETNRSTRTISLQTTNRSDLSGITGGAFGTSIENFSASIVLDSRGFVRKYRFKYNLNFGGQPVQVTQLVEFKDIGTTTLDRPTWTKRNNQSTPVMQCRDDKNSANVSRNNTCS